MGFPEELKSCGVRSSARSRAATHSERSLAAAASSLASAHRSGTSSGTTASSPPLPSARYSVVPWKPKSTVAALCATPRSHAIVLTYSWRAIESPTKSAVCRAVWRVVVGVLPEAQKAQSPGQAVPRHSSCAWLPVSCMPGRQRVPTKAPAAVAATRSAGILADLSQHGAPSALAVARGADM